DVTRAPGDLVLGRHVVDRKLWPGFRRQRHGPRTIPPRADACPRFHLGALRFEVMVCAHFLLISALAANPDLEKATRLVNDLQYQEARAALDAALKRPGNDRQTLLSIYELQGIVYATLNDSTRAVKAFQTLCVMDP